MADDISKLSEQTCCAFIPEYYDGVLEALRIQQINDAEIDPFVASIMRFFRNAYIQTADDDVISEYENELDISPVGTIQVRRQAVIDKINSDFILNDEDLINIINSIPGCEDVDYKVDSELLTLRIKKETNIEDEGEAEDLKNAFKAVLPIVPLNLEVSKNVISHNDIETISSYGWTNSLQSSIGEPAFVKGLTHYGYLTASGEDVSVGEIQMGNFTGGIVVKYDSNLKEVKADKGSFTGGNVVKYDSNLVQINIPMGYM